MKEPRIVNSVGDTEYLDHRAMVAVHNLLDHLQEMRKKMDKEALKKQATSLFTLAASISAMYYLIAPKED